GGRLAESAGKVDRLLAGPRAGELLVGGLVGASDRVELDALDLVEVHDDVADVAGEQHPLAVSRDDEILVDVGATEAERVEAVPAVDDIAAVAGIPEERIVAGAEQRRVVALAAGHA